MASSALGNPQLTSQNSQISQIQQQTRPQVEEGVKVEKSLTPFTPSVLADTEKVRGEILKTRLRLSEAEQRRHTREREESR